MILFWVLGVALLASAVFVVTAKKPVYSVVGLLAHFAVLAIFYLTLSAEFLAVIQIVVYSGAIVILFVFVIALLSSGIQPFSVGPDRMPKAAVPGAIVTLLALTFVVYGVSRTTTVAVPHTSHGSTLGVVGNANVFGSVADFGRSLFTTHLLPFEMTAFILMVAVIGVVALAGDAGRLKQTHRQEAVNKKDMREAIVRAGES
ncbi:MAG: hypothetical protein NVSMB31_09470 [Vulcanimicrobiaceae bacterium]